MSGWMCCTAFSSTYFVDCFSTELVIYDFFSLLLKSEVQKGKNIMNFLAASASAMEQEYKVLNISFLLISFQ